MSSQHDAGPGLRPLPLVLIVDDLDSARKTAGVVVEEELGWRVISARDGQAGLELLRSHRPDLVLTDLQMPEMTGLELIERVREEQPEVPVVVMTAFGTEATAIDALRAGAASYVPKTSMVRDLPGTLESVYSSARVRHRQSHLLSRMTMCEFRFELENDRSLVPDLVAFIQDHYLRMGICDGTEALRVGIAAEESILNAMYHGNLEVSSDLRDEGDEPYHALADQRRQMSPYRERRIYVAARLTREEAELTIRDQGPGFDPSKLPDPTDPENLDKGHGRGLLLIRTFMNEVRYNATGNEITLVKRPAPACST